MAANAMDFYLDVTLGVLRREYEANRIVSLIRLTGFWTQGVFLVKMKKAFVPVKRDHSVNTYSGISTVPRGSERSE